MARKSSSWTSRVNDRARGVNTAANVAAMTSRLRAQKINAIVIESIPTAGPGGGCSRTADTLPPKGTPPLRPGSCRGSSR